MSVEPKADTINLIPAVAYRRLIVARSSGVRVAQEPAASQAPLMSRNERALGYVGSVFFDGIKKIVPSHDVVAFESRGIGWRRTTSPLVGIYNPVGVSWGSASLSVELVDRSG